MPKEKEQSEKDPEIEAIEDLIYVFLDESIHTKFRDWLIFHDYDEELITFVEHNSGIVNRILNN